MWPRGHFFNNTGASVSRLPAEGFGEGQKVTEIHGPIGIGVSLWSVERITDIRAKSCRKKQEISEIDVRITINIASGR